MYNRRPPKKNQLLQVKCATSISRQLQLTLLHINCIVGYCCSRESETCRQCQEKLCRINKDLEKLPTQRDKNHHMILWRASGQKVPNWPLLKSLPSSPSVTTWLGFGLSLCRLFGLNFSSWLLELKRHLKLLINKNVEWRFAI